MGIVMPPMQTEQSGSVSDPILIDERFFRSLSNIIGELQEVGLKEVSEKKNAPLDIVRRIAAGEVPEAYGEVAATADPIEEIHRQYEQKRRAQDLSEIQDEVQYRNRVISACPITAVILSRPMICLS
ncbi:hypothetical protein ACUXST_001468 [Sphingomonas sp. F9_3S_D5_B_2]